MKWKLLACIFVAVMVAGCGGGDDPAESGGPTKNAASAPAPPPPPAPVDSKPAVTGVGKKGQGYGGGFISTPVAQFWSIQQTIEFNIKTPATLKLYHATNGRFPKTHEEFMKEIIEKGMIKLPELPPGETYRYDPEKAAKQSHYDAKDPPLWVDKTR